ncbi:MAG: YabP/YqfC family sporulation protein [Oscillospiraceae bacterium]|nr:YabP/YqfC family sporulation protein [Oscillospiraceae bacterium]
MSEQIQSKHNLILEGRSHLSLSGVTDAESFDENCISVYTEMGELVIRGKGLKVGEMSVETGNMTVDGDIKSIVYGDKHRKRKLTLWGKITQ